MGHLQEAHWFYIDNLQQPGSQKVGFTYFVHQFVPMLKWQHCDVKPRIKAYWKSNALVPRAGGILLNSDQSKILLVRGYGSKRWGFPVGKVKVEEEDRVCAEREVFEETGFQGVLPENPRVFVYRKKKSQHSLFVFENVPEDYNFAPQTCKEIDEIRWFRFGDLVDVLPKKLRENLVDFLGVYSFASDIPFNPALVNSGRTLQNPDLPEISSCESSPHHVSIDLLSLEPFAPLPPLDSVDRVLVSGECHSI